LEMVGYFDDRRGSQTYPRGLAWAYPSRGNFIAMVSNLRSWRLLRRVSGPFRRFQTIPFSSAVLPSFIGGIDRSDHVNFWNAGIPAIMVSDTAFFRNPHYHLPSDRMLRLNFSRMVDLTLSVATALENLAAANSK
ncbi:MAG: M28 family peptidase, partial [Acidobacteriales bacterium]|nr:M28 family peptidase [Terriglobales bacterium]